MKAKRKVPTGNRHKKSKSTESITLFEKLVIAFLIAECIALPIASYYGWVIL